VGWKDLSHPNVLPFLGVSETLFQFSIINPWVPNGDIGGRIPQSALSFLPLVSDHRIFADDLSENSIPDSLRKLPAVSSTCIRKISYMAALLR